MPAGACYLQRPILPSDLSVMQPYLFIVSVVYRDLLYFAAFRSVINKAAFRHEVYEATVWHTHAHVQVIRML